MLLTSSRCRLDRRRLLVNRREEQHCTKFTLENISFLVYYQQFTLKTSLNHSKRSGFHVVDCCCFSMLSTSEKSETMSRLWTLQAICWWLKAQSKAKSRFSIQRILLLQWYSSQLAEYSIFTLVENTSNYFCKFDLYINVMAMILFSNVWHGFHRWAQARKKSFYCFYAQTGNWLTSQFLQLSVSAIATEKNST